MRDKASRFIPEHQKIPIVIVGAGAGGLSLASRLGNCLAWKNNIQIILVNPTLTYLWKPLLHEVAAGTLASQEDEINLFAHAYANHFELVFPAACRGTLPESLKTGGFQI